jgi:hypothetical protein
MELIEVGQSRQLQRLAELVQIVRLEKIGHAHHR